jgi:hypothetical protein
VWNLRIGVQEFRVFALIADIGAAIGVLAAVGILIEARRRRRQSCWQFHLWELFALVTVVAIGLSFYAVRRKQTLEEWKVFFALAERYTWRDLYHAWPSEGPDWLLPVVGGNQYRELFVRPFYVEVYGNDLREAVKLRHLHVLHVSQPVQEQLVLLTQMPELEALVLTREWRQDEGNIEIPPLRHLRALIIEEPVYIVDTFPDSRGIGMRGVRGQVDRLVLPPIQFDDAALRSVARTKTLEYLRLSNSPVTDKGLESLKELNDLRELHLNGTAVTATGVRHLQEALPNCTIDWSPREP